MNIEIANRLVKLRKKNQFSQEDLAAKLGISRQAVSKWERAEASPDTDNLIMLAKLYGVSLDDLLNEDDEQDAADGEETDQTKKHDRISFSNGIHIEGKDGDEVHIGWNGIHVSEKNGDQVNIGAGCCQYVDEKDGIVIDDDEFYVNGVKQGRLYQFFIKFPYPVIAAIFYIATGYVYGWWSTAWIIFLTVPVYYTLITAIAKRRVSSFCFPMLPAIAFFVWGFRTGDWRIVWVVFLSIPIYYWIAHFIDGRKRTKTES